MDRSAPSGHPRLHGTTWPYPSPDQPTRYWSSTLPPSLTQPLQIPLCNLGGLWGGTALPRISLPDTIAEGFIVEAEDCRSYFLSRAQEARVLAEQAKDDRARMVNLEPAIRYELRSESDVPAGLDDDEFDNDQDE